MLVATDTGDTVANLEAWGDLEDGGFRRHARSPLDERSIVRKCLLLFNPLLGCVASVRIMMPLALSLCAVLMLS